MNDVSRQVITVVVVSQDMMNSPAKCKCFVPILNTDVISYYLAQKGFLTNLLSQIKKKKKREIMSKYKLRGKAQW